MAEEGGGWLSIAAPATLAGLSLAFSRTLWSYATIAEVYTLNALLIILTFWLIFRWRERARLDSPQGGDRSLYVAALVFGLALGVHHVTVGLMLPALAFLVYRAEGLRFFTSKRIVYAALLAALGLLIYLYLPLSASRSPAMNWGDPDSLERLWWHITGKQFQVFFSFSPERLGNNMVEFARFSVREFGGWWIPPGLILSAFGFYRSFKRDRAIFWFLVLVIAGDLAYALNYDIAEDKDAYYLPAFIALAIAAGYGARLLIELVRERGATLKGRQATAVALVLIISLATFLGNRPYNNRSRYFIAHDYVDNVLKPVESRGMLLTLDWQVYSPFLYFREIENKRRDVVAIDLNLLRRSWYFDYLGQSYPDLIGATRDKVGAFVEVLKHWESDNEIFERDLSLNKKINDTYNEMLRAFVTAHLQTGPVYITQDLALNRDGQYLEFTRWLATTYQFVPQGLVFRLATTRELPDSPEVELETRGLADGTVKVEPDDTVKLKVLPVYTGMLVNRGRYLSTFNRHEQAIALYERALSLDPDFAPARQSLNESLAALKSLREQDPR